MTTTEELLDATARVQGWVDYPSDSVEQGAIWHLDKDKAPHGRWITKAQWDPLKNSNQALALAALLRLEIHWPDEGEVVVSHDSGVYNHQLAEWTEHHGDPISALRRAIVRVAAEVYKQRAA